jgi:hypothetical protein
MSAGDFDEALAAYLRRERTELFARITRDLRREDYHAAIAQLTDLADTLSYTAMAVEMGDETPPNHHQLDAWHTALSGVLALLRSVEP